MICVTAAQFCKCDCGGELSRVVPQLRANFAGLSLESYVCDLSDPGSVGAILCDNPTIEEVRTCIVR